MKEVIAKMTEVKFTCQFVDCLNAQLKFIFNGSVQFFYIEERAVSFNQRIRGSERMRSFSTDRLIKKHLKQHIKSIRNTFFVGARPTALQQCVEIIIKSKP